MLSTALLTVGAALRAAMTTVTPGVESGRGGLIVTDVPRDDSGPGPIHLLQVAGPPEVAPEVVATHMTLMGVISEVVERVRPRRLKVRHQVIAHCRPAQSDEPSDSRD